MNERGGKASNKQVQSFMSDMKEITSVPGGIEMLFSATSSKGSAPGTKKLRLYNRGGPVGYAAGGLRAAAEMTRGGGRGDDEMLVHMSPEEYEAIEAMWGKPDINPDTGMPEYGFLSKIWKKVKRAVKKIVKSPLFGFLAPMALNVFAPGLGAAVGKTLGLAGKTAATVGNTVVKAGLGAVQGGKEGALSGVVSGLTGSGVGKSIGSKLGLGDKFGKIAGDAVIGGVGGEIGGGGFGQGALGNVLNSFQQDALKPLSDKVEGGLRGIFKPGDLGSGDTQSSEMSPIAGGPQMSPVSSSNDLTQFGNPRQPGFLSRAGNWIKDNPLLAAGAGAAIYGASQGGGDTADGPPELPPGFNDPLPQFDFTRDRNNIDSNAYYTYGQAGADQSGEAQFFQNNSIGTPSAGSPLVQHDLTPQQAEFQNLDFSKSNGLLGRSIRQLQERQLAGLGGQSNATPTPNAPPISGIDPQSLQMMLAQLQAGAGQRFQGGGYAEGEGSGRDDTIEALLSDGEYVMDAESVAMLGDGSNRAGAKRLDEMRQQLRKHKGANLKQGKFSSDAKRPMEYLTYAKGGKVKKAKGGTLRPKKMSKNRELAKYMRSVARGAK